MTSFVPVDHPRFRRAQRDIFTARVTIDCMNHQCRLVDRENQLELDACCQYGADVDVGEREGILEHRDQIAAILRPDAAAAPWFTDEEVIDPDFPSGKNVRTRTFAGGCVFLAHDQRGCAIHRASLEGGWDFHGIKPNICRLFPLSYETDAIVLSDDYPDYSCAYLPTAPTVYRAGRPDLAAIFGDDLVAALDRAEAAVLAERAAV